MTAPLEIEALEQLALELRRASEASYQGRPRRWRLWPRRTFALAAVAALLGTAAAGAGVILIDDGPDVAPAPAGDFTADQQPLPATARLRGVLTADPGGGPPWGMRLYRSEGGKPCYVIGQVVRGRLGVVTDQTFHELPLRGPGTCVDADFDRQRPLSMQSRQFVAPGEQPRTVLSGIAGPLVKEIELRIGTAQRTVSPDANGAYLAVFKGYPNITRIIRLHDGTQRVLEPPAEVP
jgi:hypothetical protein